MALFEHETRAMEFLSSTKSQKEKKWEVVVQARVPPKREVGPIVEKENFYLS